MGLASPLALFGGFMFGKWLGTLILIFGNTLGGFLLYRLAKTFFSDLIEKKFRAKFYKFIDFFNILGGGPVFNLPILNLYFLNCSLKTLLGF